MTRSREELLEEIRKIRGIKQDFIEFLRNKGLRIPLNATWRQIFERVLSSRKIKLYDLEFFLANITEEKHSEEIYEEERIIERKRYRKTRMEKSTKNISYIKGMTLEKEFEYLIGLLGFEYKRWVIGAGGEVGDYEVTDPSSGLRVLVSCKNTRYISVKHVNDLYANAVAFNYKHAVLLIGDNTKILEGAAERAKYLGISIINIDELRRNLFSRKRINDKIDYIRTILFGAQIKEKETNKNINHRKFFHKQIRPHKQSLLNVEGIIVEPLPNSLDDLRSELLRKHMGFLKRKISIHIDKFILYLVPYYEIEYEGRVRVGRKNEFFNGKIIVNAVNGDLEAFSIEELVDSPLQFKEPANIRFKFIHKIVKKANEKFLMKKAIDYIVSLETRYHIIHEGLFTSREEILTLRDIFEDEEIIDLEEAYDLLETNYGDDIEREYIPKKNDVKIMSKQLYYIPYWCVEYAVMPKNQKRSAWMLASLSDTEVYIEDCPWK